MGFVDSLEKSALFRLGTVSGCGACVSARENLFKSAWETRVLKTRPVEKEEPTVNLLVRLSNRNTA